MSWCIVAMLVLLTRVAIAQTAAPANDDSFFGIRVAIAQTAAPANDDFANAEAIGVGKTSITVDLTASTLEPGETANPNQVGSVWYKWVAPTNGIARFSRMVLTPLPTPAAASTIPA